MENRKYKVGEIFKNIKTTKHITKPQIENNPGKTLVITGGDEKYGVSGFYNVPAVNKGNCITFSRTSSNAFYRDRDFNGLDSVAALYHEKLTENTAIYLITCFKKNADGYSYGNKRLPEKLKSEDISLPSIIHEDGTYEPDWEYMENYIANLRKKINIYTQDSIKIIENAKSHRGEKIDTSNWREYKNKDIFEITGIKSNKNITNSNINIKKDSKYNIASLGATDENNQVQGYAHSDIFDTGNIISCNIFSGRCFYQKENVIAGSHGLIKIKIKNKNLTENLGLFITVCLNRNIEKYNRQHQRSGTVIKEETVSLPSIIHDDGTYEPDWEYMENYMKRIKEKV